jgi:hypothetical protein
MVKTHAAHLPGPPELLPGLPDAVIDLQTDDGARLVAGTWRYSDTQVAEVDFVDVGDDLARQVRRTARTTSSLTPKRPSSTTPHGGSLLRPTPCCG